MSRGRTEPMTPAKRARLLELLAELGSVKLVAERLGVAERRAWATRHRVKLWEGRIHNVSTKGLEDS